MERLKNKDILIGREPEQSRLMVTININGQPKTAFLGQFHSVPNTVSRCQPLAGTAHCKISVDGNAHMIITNLNPANITYVNNCSVQAKPVTTDEQIQLGANKFPIAVNTIVEIAKKMIPEVPKEYSIRHLEKAWDEYSETMRKIVKIDKLLNLIKPIFSACMIGCGFLDFGVVLRIVFWISGTVLMLYSIYDVVTNKTDKRKERIQLDFEKRYVCPHCNRYLIGGNFQPYRRLLDYTACPYCHSKWTNK